MTTAQTWSAIRFATFEILGIRHTCRHDWRSQERTDEESEEIHQEDHFLLDLLEGLMEDLERELERLRSLRQERDANKHLDESFWNGYWLPRMEQVRQSIESAEIEENDKVAAEEIGVVWHEEESESAESSDIEIADGGYHESDWNSEVDEEAMFRTFRTLDDWNSRPDLIVKKAMSR